MNRQSDKRKAGWHRKTDHRRKIRERDTDKTTDTERKVKRKNEGGYRQKEIINWPTLLPEQVRKTRRSC